MTLNVNSMFESISGEAGGFPQGTWITGVRLQGCNLNPGCSWCDTNHARAEANENESGQRFYTPVNLFHLIEDMGNKHILITGGEPLLQLQVIELIEKLLARDYEVQVETNGTLTIPCIPGVHWVVDFKCLSSGVTKQRYPVLAFIDLLKNLKCAGNNIYLKFVVADSADVKTTVNVIREFLSNDLEIPFIISPIDAKGEGIKNIVNKIRAEDSSILDYVIFSVQLHKLFKLP